MRLLAAFTLILSAFVIAGAVKPAPFVRQQPQGQPAVAEDLDSINKRVRELYGAKKYEEAAKLAQAAVEAAERQFGPDSPQVGMALMNLANILAVRRDVSKARNAMTRLVALREKHPGAPLPHEREALELFTCLDASDMKEKPNVELVKRIHRLLVEDSVLEQGYKLSPDKAELKGGELLSKPQPKYPGEALDARARGAAILRITIDEAGKVVEVAPLDCSSQIFNKAGAEAARRATFNPTLVNGKPVRVSSVIIYRFVIQ
ncbi:MAG: TonB family protein [Acidobacteria bacterium]|nr:TonB family protein [Acidobacteriota bacterium]